MLLHPRGKYFGSRLVSHLACPNRRPCARAACIATTPRLVRPPESGSHQKKQEKKSKRLASNYKSVFVSLFVCMCVCPRSACVCVRIWLRTDRITSFPIAPSFSLLSQPRARAETRKETRLREGRELRVCLCKRAADFRGAGGLICRCQNYFKYVTQTHAHGLKKRARRLKGAAGGVTD